MTNDSIKYKLDHYIEESIVTSNLKGGIRIAAAGEWDIVLNSLEYIPVHATRSSIEYQLEYQRSSGGYWCDLPLILYHNNQPCGIWPITYSMVNGTPKLSSQGRSLCPPIFTDRLSKGGQKNFNKKCFKFLLSLSRALDIKTINSYQPFSGGINFDLSGWHNEMMLCGGESFLEYELYVDLSLDVGDIKSGFRKSYKSLINSGSKLWDVGVMRDANLELWNQFRLLHIDAAGRETRPLSTWDLHLDAIRLGNAFLVYLLNPDGAMVGAGYFDVSRDEAVYGVGAYNRLLFDSPLGHVVQYHAILELKDRNVAWYKIGDREYPGTSPTTKELAISSFKQGFSTHLFPRAVTSLNLID